MRIAVIFRDCYPYWLARLRSLRKYFDAYGICVIGKRCFCPDDANAPCEERPLPLNRKIRGLLDLYAPDIVLVPGWSEAFALAALRWAKEHKKIAILMSASKRDDARRLFLKEWLKSRRVRMFDGAIVGGDIHKKYLEELGMPPDRIVTGYDVVDNEVIAEKASRFSREGNRPLANRYFLIISRLIRRKNIARALNAYRLYRDKADEKAWDLVICGDGQEMAGLRIMAEKSGLAQAHFTGLLQEDEICRYLAFAEALIHPAYQEQWGLVVNEAMAAGKPVVVSKACGCRYDLVRDGENGILFNPYDAGELAGIMVDLTAGRHDLAKMGTLSRQIIKNYSPEIFAGNVSRLINSISYK